VKLMLKANVFLYVHPIHDIDKQYDRPVSANLSAPLIMEEAFASSLKYLL